MTPAEKLAAKKPKQHYKHKPPKSRRVWNCRLREPRMALGLTMKEVAEAIGMSPAGYHAIETHGNDPLLSTCFKLSEFFGKPITEIWTKLKEQT